MPTVALIAGSTRSGSVNRRLARAIALRLEDEDGVRADVVDLSDYPMPIYDGDDEAAHGVPDSAIRLAERLSRADAVVFISPEYNASLTPLLKNTIDWLSRDVAPHRPFDRVFALAAASPGGLGGIRMLSHMRDILVSIGAREIVTPQLAVGGAGQAFGEAGDEAGRLVAERPARLLNGMVAILLARIAG